MVLANGLLKTLTCLHLSFRHYIDLMPHNPLGPVSTAACIHLGAAVPNFAYLEDNFSEGKSLTPSISLEQKLSSIVPFISDRGCWIE